MTEQVPIGAAGPGPQEPAGLGGAAQPVAPPDVRKSRLATAVQQEVSRGGRVESQADFSALIRHGKPVNHVLHLILTLVTFGFWVIVWIIAAIVSANNNRAVSLLVDEFGQVLRQEL